MYLCIQAIQENEISYYSLILQYIQMKGTSGDSIKVFLRVRPLNEKQNNSKSCVSFDATNIKMNDNDPDHRFSYDHIFGMESKQQQVYDIVGHEVVNSAFQGFNGTVFAYGQTSSGKTHTCIGPDYNDVEKQGILPRLVKHIFENIQKAPTFIEFRIKISIVEIYLEKIKDLIDIQKTDLKIRERTGKGIYIQDVSQQYVASTSQTFQIIKKGINNRAVGQTNMNDTSSRSHMAFIITIYQNNLKDSSAKSGKIILVDLAGSEKVSKTGAQGKLLDEAKQINKSLSALGNVINSLTDNKVSHIPYRDSKLTRLLQQSLGGNSRTNLIINVSPSQLNDQETLSSLRFGFRAKQIKNKPKINRQYTVAELLLLLEKSQKRNQQLQLYIKQLTANPNASILKDKRRHTMKKSNQVYVENLLDSDNPIIQSQEDIPTFKQKQKIDEKEQYFEQTSMNKSLNKSKMKLHFESECQESDSESDNDGQIKKIKTSIHKNREEQTNEQKLDQVRKNLEEEKQILCEEIQSLNIEKVQLLRNLDIIEEKYQIISKDVKVSNNKMLYLQKENQKFLEKVVSESCAHQESLAKMKQMEGIIQQYEDEILSLAAVQTKQPEGKDKAIMSMFGVPPKISSSEKVSPSIMKMIEIVKKNKSKNIEGFLEDMDDMNPIDEKINKQMQENISKDQQINNLRGQTKRMKQQMALFNHLEEAKQSFIQQKLKFSEERQRLYKDLSNRIQKVLQLEEKLDQSGQKIKYYEQLVKMSESQKGRKITLLQQHLNQVSENYYVLKGQQSSWLKDNKKTQSKIQSKNKRIVKLEKQIMTLREQTQNLKVQLEEYQDDHQDRKSILDLDFSEIDLRDQNQNRGNIVKVVKSSSFKVPEQIFG